MKKKNLLTLLMIPLMLTACDSGAPVEEEPPHTPVVKTYKVAFANYDGTILKSYDVRKHFVPEYDGATPTRYCEDYLNEYVFAGWDKEITPVMGDVTYTATFDFIERAHDMDLGYPYNEVAYKGPIHNCTLSDWLLDFSIGRAAAEGDNYNCNIGGITIGSMKSTNNDIVEVVKGNSASSFMIKAKKPGNAVISITNDLGDMIYRELIRVRPAQTPETLIQMLANSSLYETCKAVTGAGYGSWKFASLEKGENPRFVIEGGDDYESNMFATFTLEYDQYVGGYSNLYSFKARDIETNSKQTTIYCIDITKTGDLAYVYYNSGLNVSLLTLLNNSAITDYLDAK